MEVELHLSQPGSILNLQNPNPWRNVMNLHTLSMLTLALGSLGRWIHVQKHICANSS